MAETGSHTPFPADLLDSAGAVLAACRGRGWMLGTAESCTGGLVAAALTSISGSSDVVSGGFVTYSNAAKTRLLGVPADLLAANGAVSAPVAEAMAWGALERADLDIAVALTGIAGPGGGSKSRPVGLVHFAVGWQTAGETRVLAEKREYGDLGRDAVRLSAVRTALELLLGVCEEESPQRNQ
jgi:nicotinamide-nucleotide amidase